VLNTGRRQEEPARTKEGHFMAMERWRPFGLSTMDRWEPFRVSDIQSEVNRLFDNFFGRPASATERTWTPPVEMYATKDDLVLTVEMPGVSEKDVTVSITGDLLTLKGERRFENQVKEQDLLHVERTYGKFERLIQLPMPVQADRVKATYRDGVLEIKLPKAEELKPKEIKIDIL
jgi:HSP20 family protein